MKKPAKIFYHKFELSEFRKSFYQTEFIRMQRKVRIVFKVEIDTLFDDNGKVSPRKTEQLTMVCANLQNSGISIALVSSGAIALGAGKLGQELIPLNITGKQATAAVGQAELIIMYQDYFDHYDQTLAQVLLTRDVTDSPVRNRNARNTLACLLDQGIVPVINENDSVSTSDIILNDNYPLVLIVASLTDADAIVVNTYEEGRFLLIKRNCSEIIELNAGELPDFIFEFAWGKQESEGDIEGFPDFTQYADK